MIEIGKTELAPDPILSRSSTAAISLPTDDSTQNLRGWGPIEADQRRIHLLGEAATFSRYSDRTPRSASENQFSLRSDWCHDLGLAVID